MINKLISALILAATLSFSAQAEFLENAISVEYMTGESNVEGGRIAYRPYKTMLQTPEWLGIGMVDLEYEFSVSFWEFKGPGVDDLNHAIAFTPIFSQQFYLVKDKFPLKWEFAIGLSLVEDTRFADKDLGSRFQFEDRFGLVFEFGPQLRESLALRYMHYSNGGLNDDNPGLDYLNVGYAYRF